MKAYKGSERVRLYLFAMASTIFRQAEAIVAAVAAAIHELPSIMSAAFERCMTFLAVGVGCIFTTVRDLSSYLGVKGKKYFGEVQDNVIYCFLD